MYQYMGKKPYYYYTKHNYIKFAHLFFISNLYA